MSTVTKPSKVPAAKASPQPDPVKKVRAVYGAMIDPFTNETYTQEGLPVGEIREGSWLDCQIKRGKLELC